MTVTFSQAAKEILDANKTALSASLLVVTNDKARAATAAQTIALTAYEAFNANGGSIPAADIAAYCGMTEAAGQKLKQYVSRAKKLYDNKGAAFTVDGVELTIDHEAIMSDTPPSLTTLYKQYNKGLKQAKEAQEAAQAEQATKLKAANLYLDSLNGESMPVGVTDAASLIAIAAAHELTGDKESAHIAALNTGLDMVQEAATIAAAQASVADAVESAQAIIDSLLAMETEQAGDAVVTIAAYIEAQQNAAIAKRLAA